MSVFKKLKLQLDELEDRKPIRTCIIHWNRLRPSADTDGIASISARSIADRRPPHNRYTQHTLFLISFCVKYTGHLTYTSA
jgi:hypothetical protein